MSDGNDYIDVPPEILLKVTLIYALRALERGVPAMDLCFAIEDVCNDYAEAVHEALEAAAEVA